MHRVGGQVDEGGRAQRFAFRQEAARLVEEDIGAIAGVALRLAVVEIGVVEIVVAPGIG